MTKTLSQAEARKKSMVLGSRRDREQTIVAPNADALLGAIGGPNV